MLQNSFSFHQSSVSLEIIGLPDYSNDENKDQISIISDWNLKIINKPLIEGKIEHLGPIMDAFYIYSNLLVTNQVPLYKSKLIDIKADNLHIHNIVLKSSKPGIEPLIIKIGNSFLSDIVNCFDQLNESSKIRIKKSGFFHNIPKKVRFPLNKKIKFYNYLLPPLISICSLVLFSSTLIYFYDPIEMKEKNELLNLE